MAVTKILARRGGLAQAIAYVVNGDKTEEQVLTAAQGCSLGSACAEMQDRWEARQNLPEMRSSDQAESR